MTSPATVGPFTGKHIDKQNPILPPEWNLSPEEYRRLTYADTAQLTATGIGAAVTAISGPIAWLHPAHIGDLDLATWIAWTVFITSALLTLLWIRPTVVELRRDVSALDDLDPALVVQPMRLPNNLFHLITAVADVVEDPETAAEHVERTLRLRLAYDATVAMVAVGEENGDWSLRNMVARCPEQVTMLVEVGLELGSPKAREHAAIIHASTQLFGSPASPGTAEPVEIQDAVGGQGNLRARWAASLAAHDRVAEAWTDIVTDPLNALSHSSLFDVTEPRTAAFIETYGTAQDLRAVYGQVFPATNEPVVREYLTAVRKAEASWNRGAALLRAHRVRLVA